MPTLAGYALIVLSIAHTIVGFVMYRSALMSWLRDGFFNAVHPHLDRRAAFWFLLFSATLFLLGHLTIYAVRTDDSSLLRLIAWYVLVIGAVGVSALPKSPFWAALIIAMVLFLSAT